MPLDDSINHRDYLYGRLLAVADVLEEEALNQNGGKRPTMASQYMRKFIDCPYTTWTNIYVNLIPYMNLLGDRGEFYRRLIAIITNRFQEGEYVKDYRLSGEFLLGYHCQKANLLHHGMSDDE